MNKRAIAILGAIFLLIVLTLAFLIYKKTQSSTPEDQATEEQAGTQNTENTSTQQVNKAIKLTDDQVVSPVLFYAGDGITYFTRQGQLFRNKLQVSGSTVLLYNREELNIPIKAGLQKVLWPITGDNYIAMISNGAKPSFSIFVNSRESYIDMPAKVTSMDWLPTGEQLVYLWLDNGKTTLNIANADGSNFKTLTEMWENDNKIHVSPDGRTILYYRTESTDPVNKINAVTIDGKIFKSIVKDGYNMGVLWAPDSRKFLFGKRDASTGQMSLWLGNIETGEVKNLGISTSPDKAVWTTDGTAIIAAVPDSATSSGGVTSDTLYKVSVANLQKESFDAGVEVDADELFLSADSQRVFFTNHRDGALYYFNLK
jgi:hypothetical protein